MVLCHPDQQSVNTQVIINTLFNFLKNIFFRSSLGTMFMEQNRHQQRKKPITSKYPLQYIKQTKKSLFFLPRAIPDVYLTFFSQRFFDKLSIIVSRYSLMQVHAPETTCSLQTAAVLFTQEVFCTYHVSFTMLLDYCQDVCLDFFDLQHFVVYSLALFDTRTQEMDNFSKSLVYFF